MYGNKWAEIAKALPGRYLTAYFPLENSLFHSFSLYEITLLLSVDLVNDVELLIVVIFAIVLIPNLLKRGITS